MLGFMKLCQTVKLSSVFSGDALVNWIEFSKESRWKIGDFLLSLYTLLSGQYNRMDLIKSDVEKFTYKIVKYICQKSKTDGYKDKMFFKKYLSVQWGSQFNWIT